MEPAPTATSAWKIPPRGAFSSFDENPITSTQLLLSLMDALCHNHALYQAQNVIGPKRAVLLLLNEERSTLLHQMEILLEERLQRPDPAGPPNSI